MGDIGRHFNRSEFVCKCGCGEDDISPDLVKVLDRIREMTGRPIYIISGVRCKKYNDGLKNSKPTSAHIKKMAADIRTSNSNERYEVIMYALMQGIQRIGIAKDFVHVDVDATKVQDVAWVY